MGCEHCTKAAERKYYGAYDYKCYTCRERLLMDEPCKLMRQAYVKSLEKWGEVPDWKREPSCGCGRFCKRRQYIEQGNNGGRNVSTKYR